MDSSEVPSSLAYQHQHPGQGTERQRCEYMASRPGTDSFYCHWCSQCVPLFVCSCTTRSMVSGDGLPPLATMELSSDNTNDGYACTEQTTRACHWHEQKQNKNNNNTKLLYTIRTVEVSEDWHRMSTMRKRSDTLGAVADMPLANRTAKVGSSPTTASMTSSWPVGVPTTPCSLILERQAATYKQPPAPYAWAPGSRQLLGRNKPPWRGWHNVPLPTGLHVPAQEARLQRRCHQSGTSPLGTAPISWPQHPHHLV